MFSPSDEKYLKIPALERKKNERRCDHDARQSAVYGNV
jgi:hypothetical protein